MYKLYKYVNGNQVSQESVRTKKALFQVLDEAIDQSRFMKQSGDVRRTFQRVFELSDGSEMALVAEKV